MRNQHRAPLFEAVQEYVETGIIPFHVPGHKQGRGLPEFTSYLGKRALAMDLTCLPDLDNICNPQGVIKEAEEMAAEAFGADHAYFLVNGTTSGIQAMLLTVCQPGDKIILPRNIHKSALGGLILSGAHPIYLKPEVNYEFGISMGITPEAVERSLWEHPDAQAVFVVYPNYYGTACDLCRIVEISHAHGIPVLVDEAHGSHFHFHPDLPPSAMEAGADLVASSVHKLLGSMTQSSILLLREGLIDPRRLKAILNLSQTTSPSYLLLCSLDVARKQVATRGRLLLDHVLELASMARPRLSSLPGLQLLDVTHAPRPGFQSLDPTKIVVNVHGLGLSGYQAETILRQRYHLQVELADPYNVLNLITIGDTAEMVASLVKAFADITAVNQGEKLAKLIPHLPDLPNVSVLPHHAFYGQARAVEFRQAAGEISAEMITVYPPGIPLVCPGEMLTQEIIDYVNFIKEEEAELQGPEDPRLERIKVLENVQDLRSPRQLASEAG